MSYNHKKHEKVEFDMMAHRYHSLSRPEKGKFLNKLCDLYGYNCKYLLQVFNYLTGKKYVKKGREAKYASKDLLKALSNIWLSSGQMCSKKLTVCPKLPISVLSNR